MFDKSKINLIYRIICLLVYIIVILFSENIATNIILSVLFLIITKKENNLFFIFLYFMTFMFFFVSHMNNNYMLFKTILVIDYIYYFLNIPSIKYFINKLVDKIFYKITTLKQEERSIDKKQNKDSYYEYMRFSQFRRSLKSLSLKSDLLTTTYVTIHFVILFLSIMVG